MHAAVCKGDGKVTCRILSLTVYLSSTQIEDFSLINFHPLDLTSEDSIGTLLSHIDNSMQYGEDEEPKEPKDMDNGDFDKE